MPKCYANVAVEHTAFSFDLLFTYEIPQALHQTAQPGCRVLVPFGRGRNARIGLIFSRTQQAPPTKCKPIEAVLDTAPLFHTELLELAIWLKARTFCPLFDAARAMLPAGLQQHVVESYTVLPITPAQFEALTKPAQDVYTYLRKRTQYVRKENIYKNLKLSPQTLLVETLHSRGYLCSNTDAVRKVGDATTRMVQKHAEAPSENPQKLTKKQQDILALLEDLGSLSLQEVCNYTGYTPAVVQALEKKGLVSLYDAQQLRTPASMLTVQNNTAPIQLTQEQQQCYDTLFAQYQLGGKTALLFGVTGSGKTQVYLKLIDHVLQDKRSVIVMVPEIALTPQMLSLFRGRYGNQVALFHSALSAGERADEWMRVKHGEASIALGTRSAVFAPLEDLGLIILDEEQEHTYKSEQAPRYAAKDVARFRASRHNAMVLLASATPSIETYAAAQSGQYALATLTQRYADAGLPEVITVDMKQEQSMGHSPMLSGVLLEALEATLEAKQQAILLMNRRGFNTFAVCRSCDQVVSCPNCSISMTYHSSNNCLLCHYCGYSRAFTGVCDHCGKADVRYSGYGTQRIEQELATHLPQARILRMDMDTTAGRFAHEIKLEQFRKQEYDILLGTQMVAKGLDFAKVTLVGVISVDQQLYNDDFRSLERTFSLLTQVVGRSGRGQYPGKAIIQTLTPENPIIQLAARQDYPAFYTTEMKIRKLMVYPPYCDLCVFGFAHMEQERVKAAADAALELTQELVQNEYSDVKIIVLGPMPARIAKVNQKYRYRMILKCRNTPRLRALAAQLLQTLGSRNKLSGVNMYADINPKDTI